MDRVRRVVSHGGFNYVSITADNLAVSAEKKTTMVFQLETDFERFDPD